MEEMSAFGIKPDTAVLGICMQAYHQGKVRARARVCVCVCVCVRAPKRACGCLCLS